MAICSRISRGKLVGIGACGGVEFSVVLSIWRVIWFVFARRWKSSFEVDDLRYDEMVCRG